MLIEWHIIRLCLSYNNVHPPAQSQFGNQQKASKIISQRAGTREADIVPDIIEKPMVFRPSVQPPAKRTRAIYIARRSNARKNQSKTLGNSTGGANLPTVNPQPSLARQFADRIYWTTSLSAAKSWGNNGES